MAERPLGHRKSSLVLSARFPGLKWRSCSVAKSAHYEKPRENDPWKNQHDSEAFWHFSIFGSVFFVLKSVLAIGRQRSHEKFAILILKPRSHVKILIYRTWAIPPSSPVMASEADLRLLSRAALAWLLATPRVESLLAGHVTSETRPCCCWVLFGKRLLKLTFSFYQSSCLTKSFPGFQWDIFFLAWREIYRSAAGWDIFCQRLQPWETNRGHHERLNSSKWKVFAWYLG